MLWGNRTAAYPLKTTDPKDSFIPIRSMMSWWGNREILSFWQDVDKPMLRPFFTNILTSMQLDINGLEAEGAITGGEVRLLNEENPVLALMEGRSAFHTYMGFATPAEDIVFNNEYDPRFLKALVSSLAGA